MLPLPPPRRPSRGLLLFVLLAFGGACTPAAVRRHHRAPLAPDVAGAQRDAYALARQCLPKGHAPALRFEDIRWRVAPGPWLPLRDWQTLAEKATVAMFLPADSTITVVARLARSRWVLAHEVLHALGVAGHPAPFRRCRLMPDQHGMYAGIIRPEDDAAP